MSITAFAVVWILVSVALIFISDYKKRNVYLFALGFVLFISGFFLMVISVAKPVESPDSSVLHTYSIQNITGPDIRNFLTVTLTDDDNNTVEIYSKGNDIQFVVDNQYPLAEKIRVKTLFVYKDVTLIHLDQATNTDQTVTN